MLNSLGKRFDMPEHHRCGRPTTQPMPNAVHVEPIVGQYFSTGDLFPDSVNQDFAPASWETAESSGLQPRQNLFERHVVQLSEVIEFRRAETVNVDLRKVPLDIPQHVLVPLQL